MRGRVVTRIGAARFISGAALAASGGPAAVISYQHAYQLAARLGATPLVAGMMPLTTDGVVGSASALIYTAGRSRVRPPWVAWPLLACGVAVTIVVNAAAGGGHGAGGRLVAAWPAVAFVGCLEAAVALARMTTRPPVPATVPSDTPAVPGPVPVPAAVQPQSNGHKPLPSIRDIRAEHGCSQATAVKIRNAIKRQAITP